MIASFAEVLESETSLLTRVADGAALAAWREHLIEQLTLPQSAYARAVRGSEPISDREAFLRNWHALLSAALMRLAHAGFGPADREEIRRVVTLVLASLHGGSVLSRVAGEPAPLRSALDLALAPFLECPGVSPVRAGNDPARHP